MIRNPILTSLALTCVCLPLMSAVLFKNTDEEIADIFDTRTNNNIDNEVVEQRYWDDWNDYSDNYNKRGVHCKYSSEKFPDPDDCTKYYECKHWVPRHRKCDRDQRFDPKKLKCVNKKKVDCGSDDGSRESSSDEEDAYRKFKCPYQFGTWSYPKDCSKYFLCRFYKATMLDCRKGELYDERQRQCRRASTVYCGSRRNPYDATTTTTKVTEATERPTPSPITDNIRTDIPSKTPEPFSKEQTAATANPNVGASATVGDELSTEGRVTPINTEGPVTNSNSPNPDESTGSSETGEPGISKGTDGPDNEERTKEPQTSLETDGPNTSGETEEPDVDGRTKGPETVSRHPGTSSETNEPEGTKQPGDLDTSSGTKGPDTRGDTAEPGVSSETEGPGGLETDKPDTTDESKRPDINEPNTSATELPDSSKETQEPVGTGEPATQEPVETKEPGTEGSIETKEPVSEEPFETREPDTEESVETKEPVTGEHIGTDEPVTGEPVGTNNPATNEPDVSVETDQPRPSEVPETSHETAGPGVVSAFTESEGNVASDSTMEPGSDRPVVGSTQGELVTESEDITTTVNEKITSAEGQESPAPESQPPADQTATPEHVTDSNEPGTADEIKEEPSTPESAQSTASRFEPEGKEITFSTPEATQRKTKRPKPTINPECETDKPKDVSSFFTCPERTGLFAHPYCPNLFVQCDDSKPYSKRCGKGLQFSTEFRVCVWPEDDDDDYDNTYDNFYD